MYVRTTCKGCHGGCVVVAKVEGGVVERVLIDEESPIKEKVRR